MTHLRIIQNNGVTEEVSSSVILKLYELATSGDLDNTSVLLGRLNVDGTYLEYIDELEELFDELYITATKIYIKFADDEVERILLSMNIGDGISITRSDAAALTGLFNGNSSPFMNNTTITSFDEFEYFGYTSLYSNQWEKGAFKGCTNLLSISLKNITSIGLFSFYLCSSLLTVKDFHATTIGMYAFNNTAVSSIDLSLVTNLDAAAFRNCTGLTTIDLSSLTSVGGSSSDNAVFKNCTGLTTVTNLNSTGLYMFYGCTGLTSAGLTLNCTSIALNAFLGCTGLTSIDLSNTTSIGTDAFYGCTSLTNIDLSNVTDIGGSAFKSCTSLTTVILPSNNFLMSYEVFKDSGLTGNIDVTNCTTNLFDRYYNVFAGSKITSVTAGSNVTIFGMLDSHNIGQFRECSELVKVDFSLTLITICNGSNAFTGCTKLKYLKLPNTVTQIGNMFGWTSYVNTIKIYLPCTTPPSFINSTYKLSETYNRPQYSFNVEVYVPDANVADYLNSDWGSYTILPISQYSES